MAGKWLQILKHIVPNIFRVAVIASPTTAALDSYYRSIELVSGPLAVEVVRGLVQNLSDVEHTIAAMSAKPGGALIVVPDALILGNRGAFIAQVTKYRVPAIYPFRFFANEGGLVSYGIDTREQFRGAASYVDRILRGEKPGNLPVQAPTKFELVINLTAAKALDLSIPSPVLSLADELIE